MQLLAFLLACFIAAVTAGDHPVESVIKLLRELRYKVEDEMAEEEVTFRKLRKWCVDSKDTLGKAITENKEEIDSLSDKVDSLETKVQQIKEHIAFLEEEIAKYEAEDKEAEEARKKENELWEQADKDFDTTITAVGEAITALKDSKSAAFLQFQKPQNKRQEHALRQLMQQPLVLEQLSGEQRKALSAAVSGEAPEVTEEDIMAKKKYAQAGNVYTFKSGNVIELLTDLETHFKDAKVTAEKAETAAANEYQVAKDARKDAIETAKTTKDTKTEELGTAEEDLSTAKQALSDEKDELETNSKTLENTEKTCNLKATEYKERQRLREQEKEAMKVAMRILAKVSGVRTEQPDNPVPPSPPSDAAASAAAMLLLQSVDPKQRAVNLLKKDAAQYHSKALSAFAAQLEAKLGGPFDEINGMIEKMIFRLMAEQTKEDEHKAWCDLEVATSEKSRDDKEARLKKLDTEIADAKALSDELELKISDLNKKITELTKFMAEATEVRAESKKENQATIKDAEDAQAAIAKATAVLETYYKESGMIEKEEWEFVQKGKEPEPVELPEQPASWDSSYTGVADPKKPGGVITVLKAAAEKFADLEGKTRAEEVAEQKDFDETMKDEAINKARTEKEAEMKDDEQKRTIAKINSLTKKQKHVANELGAVKQYLKDLEPACIKGDSTYEDRKAARAKEVEALKEAQVILQKAFEENSELQLQTIRKHAGI